MKVTHISTELKSGGAARASYRLHQGLLQQGVVSQVYSRFSEGTEDNVFRYRAANGIAAKLQRKLFYRSLQNMQLKYPNRPPGLELFTYDRTDCRNDLVAQIPPSDIYNLHWVSRFLDIPTFFDWVQKPVVWTLHDMNPFTGGCHYDNHCGKYASGCGACPQLGSTKAQDLSREIFERKRKALAKIPNHKIRIVADSYWLAEEARKSKIFEGKTVETIHYGLDHNLFKPRDKAGIRKLLEIPLNKQVILFGAPGVTNTRKGYKELLEAIRILSQKQNDLILLAFGGGTPPMDANIPHIHLGNISNDPFLSWVYNAADAFVIPSLQEAFGQTCLEAMACGVPCAGFDTGGIPDMIENGKTGFLAEKGNTEDLAAAIEKTLKNRDLLGHNARRMVVESFTLAHQANKYMQVYRELLANNKQTINSAP